MPSHAAETVFGRNLATFVMDQDGLGDKPGPLDLSGETFTMWNTDSFGWQATTDPTYKSIPFFINMNHGRALGLFLDNTRRTNFDFGRANPAECTFGALNGPVDSYLIYGPERKQVVTGWAWLTGPAPLPPLWSLGFQQSRYTYFPEFQLREVADRLHKDHIPSDVLWLDIDFPHNNWPFTVHEQAFPKSSRHGPVISLANTSSWWSSPNSISPDSATLVTHPMIQRGGRSVCKEPRRLYPILWVSAEP